MTGKLDFPFIPVPMALLARKDIEWLDKLIVGRILSFGDRACFLSQGRFSREFGVHRQRINERLAHLEKIGLVLSVRTRRGKTYQVVCDVRQTGQQEQDGDAEMSAKPDTVMSDKPDRTCPLNRTLVDILEDSTVDRSSRAESELEPAAPDKTNDDERLQSSEEGKTENLHPDPEMIQNARETLAYCRACSVDGEHRPEVAGTITPPDDDAVIQILSRFKCWEDFEAWAFDTASRGLGDMSRRPGWGLYLKDCARMAGAIAMKREAEAKRRADEEIAAERKRTLEAEQRRILGQPRPTEEAIAAANEQLQTERCTLRSVPGIVRQRLKRIGEPISIADVLTMARNWRSCGLCGDKGVTGSAYERTRTLCSCMAGEELRHTDPEMPQREIEYAHANLRNKLVAAAFDRAKPFLADALEHSEVSEDSDAVVIGAPAPCKISLVAQNGIPCRDLMEVARLVTGKGEVRIAP